MACQWILYLRAKMIYGYIRVSTDRQTVENQRYEIKRFCRENNLQVDKWISETISGAKEIDKRRLGKLLKGVRKDDIIICSEISRLGAFTLHDYVRPKSLHGNRCQRLDD